LPRFLLVCHSSFSRPISSPPLLPPFLLSSFLPSFIRFSEFCQVSFVEGFTEFPGPAAAAAIAAATIAIAIHAILVNAGLVNERCLCRCHAGGNIAVVLAMDVIVTRRKSPLPGDE